MTSNILNNRAVFFDCRGKFCDIPFDTFGFPLELNPKGSFWTNEVTKNEFERLMSFSIFGSDKQWSESRDPIAKKLTFYDNNNTLLRGVLNED